MGWLEDYTAALNARDAHEQADRRYIDLCTKHADERASLHAQLQRLISSAPPSTSPPPGPSTPKGRSSTTRPEPPSSPSTLTNLQSDLATAQRHRATLTTTLKSTEAELTAVQSLLQISTREKTEAARRAMLAERKLRDREEEIRVKQKMTQDVQDEHVSLELQLNMALQKVGKLERENKELVERWMERMGREAEEMNLRSNFS